jgi:DNA-binding LacI/PurR family transcriptional regulator
MAKIKKLDIHQVAKRAKVSIATVSRAVNRVATVSPMLAQRVFKAINELGYYPNTQARVLVSGRSRIFGLVVSELTNPFFPEIVQFFETIAVKHHCEILLASTMNDSEQVLAEDSQSDHFSWGKHCRINVLDGVASAG